LLIIFLPAAGIIVASNFEHREDAIREAKNRAVLLVLSLAARQEQINAATKQMLSTLAQFRAVRNLDAAACNELFRELHRENPFYSFIGAATPEGKIFASDAPFDAAASLADRKYIREVMNTLDFSVGEYMVGRVSKVPSIN